MSDVKARLVAAMQPQIAEGLGAILRKYCDSPQALRARQHLHAMPVSDWNVLVDMLADACADAAIQDAATEAEGRGDE